MARPTKKMTTTANGAVVSGQEDLTKLKNLTHKATQSAEKSASDKAMDELVALDQELGLYNITTNPLIKSNNPPAFPTLTKFFQKVDLSTPLTNTSLYPPI